MRRFEFPELMCRNNIKEAAEILVNEIATILKIDLSKQNEQIYFENILVNVQREFEKKKKIFLMQMDIPDLYDLVESTYSTELMEFYTSRRKSNVTDEEVIAKVREHYEKKWEQELKTEYSSLMYQLSDLVETESKNVSKERSIIKIKVAILERFKVRQNISYVKMLTEDDDVFWIIDFPKHTNEYAQKYKNAIKYGKTEVIEENLRKLIALSPEAEINAYQQLGMLLKNTNRKIEGYSLIEKAFKLAYDKLPTNFDPKKDKIIYAFYENRTFLNVAVSYGNSLFEQGMYDHALKIFDFIFNTTLESNSYDRYEVAQQIMNCYLGLKLPEYVININSWEISHLKRKYHYLYGRVLAYFQIGDLVKAEEALKVAVKKYPYIRRELIKKEHFKPTDYESFVSELGINYQLRKNSPLEAYLYWEETEALWSQTEGIKEFLKKTKLP